MASADTAEPFGRSWAIAPEGQPPTALRCQCSTPMIVEIELGETGCLKCGRAPSVRPPAPWRVSESVPAATNGTAAGDRTPEPVHANARARSGATAPRRRSSPKSNGNLSLVELGRLVERFPQIDWSPAIEAAAQEERRRAAAL